MNGCKTIHLKRTAQFAVVGGQFEIKHSLRTVHCLHDQDWFYPLGFQRRQKRRRASVLGPLVLCGGTPPLRRVKHQVADIQVETGI